MAYRSYHQLHDSTSSYPLLDSNQTYDSNNTASNMSRPNHFEQVDTQSQQRDQSNSSDNTLTPSSSSDYATALPKAQAQFQQPPPLNYSLHEHKTSIAITWSIIVTSSGILPVLLYWVLSRATNLSLTVVFAVASAISAVSILDFFVRLYKLLAPPPGSSNDRRPLHQSRYSWDIFQIEFFVGIVVITVMIAVGNSVGPNTRLLAMPAPFLMTWVGAQMLLLAWPAAKGAPAPFPVSSLARGEPIRPVVYVLIEDIVAVNGGGCCAYRERLDARYRASPVFRRLLAETNLAWGVVATSVGIALIALIWTIDAEVAYTLGWSVPWVVAGLGAWLTIVWARKRLADERAWFEGARV